MQKHLTHKNISGFTLIELLIVIAIIGILAAIAIPQFNQYKIRGYDTSAKQGLRDVALLCNAYWIDNDCTEECSLPKIMAATYGFNQNSDLVVTLPAPSSQCSNFCASAKSNSSPNTFSIDSAALISSGSTCGGAGGSVQTASAGGSVPIAYDPATQPEERPCTMIPDKIYNEDGSPYVYPQYWSGDNSHPFSGQCVRYDKKTETYYMMSSINLKPGHAGSFLYDKKYYDKGKPPNYGTYQFDNVRHLLGLFVKQSGIGIPEGEVPPTSWANTMPGSANSGSGSRVHVEGTPWRGWLDTYKEAQPAYECEPRCVQWSKKHFAQGTCQSMSCG